MLKILLVLSLVVLGAHQDDDEDADLPKLQTLSGAIKSVVRVEPPQEGGKGDSEDSEDDSDFGDSDGDSPDDHGIESFNVTAKRKTFKVSLWDDVTLTEHVAMPIASLPQGTKIWVLGRYQAPQRLPEQSHTLRAQIIQIQIVVAGKTFSAPELTAKQKETKLKWHEGLYSLVGGSYSLNGTAMQIGKGTRVLTISRVKARKRFIELIRKRQRVALRGVLDPDRKKKAFTAYEIVIPAKKMPRKAYSIVFPPRS